MLFLRRSLIDIKQTSNYVLLILLECYSAAIEIYLWNERQDSLFGLNSFGEKEVSFYRVNHTGFFSLPFYFYLSSYDRSKIEIESDRISLTFDQDVIAWDLLTKSVNSYLENNAINEKTVSH